MFPLLKYNTTLFIYFLTSLPVVSKSTSFSNGKLTFSVLDKVDFYNLLELIRLSLCHPNYEEIHFTSCIDTPHHPQRTVSGYRRFRIYQNLLIGSSLKVNNLFIVLTIVNNLYTLITYCRLAFKPTNKHIKSFNSIEN